MAESSFVERLRGDLFGGVTAAVVALPLALAFGVASGAGPVAGLYGAIFAGFFASLFGGTSTQVTGPTGPMTVVMAVVLTRYAGEPSLAFTVVMMGGAFQILIGLLKIGRYVAYVPFKVVSGFMSGIGCIIIILQLAPMLGHQAGSGGVLAALRQLPEQLAHPNWPALAMGMATLFLVMFMPARLRVLLPSPLAALILGGLAAAYWPGSVPVIGPIPELLPTVIVPNLSLDHLPGMLQSAMLLGALGAIDSLLTSLAADSATRTRHNSNRELVGQGIGNIAAGLFGGLASAGATMRTMVNIRAGGSTRLSGMFHSVLLLSLLLGLAPLASNIPYAVLAGILIKVGWDIIDWRFLRRLRRAPRDAALVVLTVMILTVFVNLITAVAVGILMTSLISAERLSVDQVRQMRLLGSTDVPVTMGDREKELMASLGQQVLYLHLSGSFSFGSATELMRKMPSAGDTYRSLVLDVADITSLDTSIAMALELMIEAAVERHHEVYLIGLDSEAARFLDRIGVLEKVAIEHRYDDRILALEAISEQLQTLPS